MKKVSIFLVGLCALVSVASATPSVALPSVMSVESLTDSIGTFTTYGGLLKDGNNLYFGDFDYVRTYDLNSSSSSAYAECGTNAGIGTVNKIGTDIYMSKDTSYYSPYPSDFGTIDPTNGFQATMPSGTTIGSTTYSIYDSTTYGGNLYFVANIGTYVDDGEGGQTGQTSGTKILRYDTASPSAPVEIATIGGSTGGLTFDTMGNMYYASQNTGEGILKFSAAEVATGGLTAADGDSVLDITAASIGFLSDGTFVAETGWGQALSAYNIETGLKRHDIATTSGSDYMGKFVIGEDDTIYILSTNWDTGPDSSYEYYGSTLSAITVPEPMTIGLLASGAVAMLIRKRRK